VVQESSERAATSSIPEDLFVELFTQVFGLEKALLLFPQYPVKDIYEGNRYVDYALRTRDQRIAFEVDGLTWHVPDATSGHFSLIPTFHAAIFWPPGLGCVGERSRDWLASLAAVAAASAACCQQTSNSSTTQRTTHLRLRQR